MSIDTDVASRLKGMKTKFAEAQQNPDVYKTGFNNMPDGKYKVLLTTAELKISQSSDNLMVAWGFTIQEGQNAGEVIWDYQNVEGDDGWTWVFKRMQQLGISVRELTLDDVAPALELLVNARLVMILALATGKTGFQGKYINKIFNPLGSESSDNTSEYTADVVEETVDTSAFGIGDKVQYTPKDGSDGFVGLVTHIEGNKVSLLYNKKTYVVDTEDLSAA